MDPFWVEQNRIAREQAQSKRVDKDEHCDCSCHDQGLTSDDCPSCYYVDGFAGLIKRLDEHQAKYPSKW
jgi:hypothetical protein